MFIEFRNYISCIQSNNFDSIELAVSRIFELEGCRRISQPPQTLSNEELRQTSWLLLSDLWIVGLFVSTLGWTIVKTQPNELLCCRARGTSKFSQSHPQAIELSTFGCTDYCAICKGRRSQMVETVVLY
ncbi:hypothetical protein [Nostoc sp. WHI]|uniref:hypothetical protein n=1 Tax=Nostoc sp. WHI TaxID=2650611 RepID=UPI0018C6599D|nr:hypothetical protein [Nostoc sp. WHI]MBG1266333.1 hypothetical protein [Nostoc sp. WHI]